MKKAVYDYTAGAWTLAEERLFVYDGWNLVEEIKQEGGNETSRYFVWGLDMSQSMQGAGGIGGLVASVDSSSGSSLTYYFCYDGNGNVGQVVNAADGSIAAAYEYDPYGKVLKADGAYAEDNPFRFSTKYHDDETDLVYYGYRYYSSELGRWVSRDHLGDKSFFILYAEHKSIQAYNELKKQSLSQPYLFNNNNSIDGIDSYGLAIYTGLVNLKGGGAIGGGAILYGPVRTKCKGGKYQTGILTAVFIGATVGLPVGSTIYTITQKDSLPGMGDLKSLNGLAAITSLSASLGAGIYIYDLTLGITRSVGEFDGSVDAGPELGVDLDAIAMGGYSHVSAIKEHCCIEEEN